MRRLACSVLATVALAAAPAFGAGKLIYAGGCGGVCVLPDDGSTGPALVLQGGDYPRWSPDGTRFVYRTQFQIATAAADGSDVHVLTTDGAADRVNSLPAWSPDGGQIVFTQQGHTMLMNADGSARRALFPGSTRLDSNAAFSADGQRILFIRSASGTKDLLSAKLDGTGLRRLTTGWTHGQPVPSPDGRQFAFVVHVPGTTRSDIWIASTEDGAVRRVTPAGTWSLPAWSSDGSGLIAASAQKIYRLDIGEGDGAVSLPDSLGAAQPADWWVPERPARAEADHVAPTLVIFSGAPVATGAASGRTAIVQLRWGQARGTIVAKRSRLRFAVADKTGIAQFSVVAKRMFAGGPCLPRARNDLGSPHRCRRGRFVASSAAALRALPKRLKPGRYGLVVRTRDVLGNKPKFPLLGTLVVKR